MPIMTTLEITRSSRPRCWRRKCAANHSWEMMSPVVRLRLKPWWPVEQKRQPTAQPACEEMHRVPRSVSGIKTVSMTSPAPTSNSHLMVPSVESWRETTLGPWIWAEPVSFSRRDFARSVICVKSVAPFWWSQRRSWGARKRFSPSRSQKAAKPSRSKSRRLAVIAAGSRWNRPKQATALVKGSEAWGRTWLTRVNVHAGEEEGDFHLGGFRGVGTVHGIGVNAVGEVGANGAGSGLLRVGGTHQVAI